MMKRNCFIPVLLLLCSVTAFAQVARQHETNYDARVAHNAGFTATPTNNQLTAFEYGRQSIAALKATFDPDTGATRVLYNVGDYLTGPSLEGEDVLDIAMDFVHTNATLLGLDEVDLQSFEISDDVVSNTTGAHRIYLRQMYQGLPVYNALLQVNINRKGRVISVNNTWLPAVHEAANGSTPQITAARAVLRAAAELGLKGELPLVVEGPEGVGQRTVISAGYAAEPIVAQLMVLPIRAGSARLVWNFLLHTQDSQHVYDINVDAQTGKTWTRLDQVVHEQYLVYPQPVESPIHTSPAPPADARQTTGIPHPPSSPNGWHDTGSTSYTITRGNNVHAYEDSNNSGSGSSPDCGGTLDCSFPMDLTQDPNTYTDAAVANLFFWNNIIHDVTYQYGFDEAGGNFQVNNFGNGGAGGDDVRAEAQDGGGTNNANFFTPADGSRPRMQMYLWTTTSPRRDGDFDNGIIIHEYGHGISNRLVGGPNSASCLGNSQQPGEGLSDWWSLWFTAEAGDVGTDRRGVGTYALGEAPDGDGIRTQAYSTDPAVNTHTYESINGMAVPHGVGEVWAQAAWECYWALVDNHGFSSNYYDPLGGSGNQRMHLYVIEGLKNTACSPTFTDVRDGIIQAATDNYGGEDVCTLWTAFAAFGLGEDAVSGGSNSTNPTNGFAVPASCQCSPQPNADAGGNQTICQGDSVTLGTASQPNTTYSWSPGGATSAQITVTPGSTTTYTVTATTSCGSASDSATVVVDDGSGGGLDEDAEGGLGAWTATGLWHVVTNTSCASPGSTSGTNAFYYGQDSGCNYDTGGTTTGDLTSPVINGINASSTLDFQFYRQVESYSGAYDKTEVSIIHSGGTTVVWSRDSSDVSAASWQAAGPIDLSAYAGDSIQVRFSFNSVDSVSNGFTGWLIDDVVVLAESQCTGGNTAPTVTITAPADGTAVIEGDSVTFAGSANDTEDGDLTAALVWSSSIDGVIGSGGGFSTSSLSIGNHVITAAVSDSGSLSGDDQISLTVNPCTPDPVADAGPDQTTCSGTAVTLGTPAQSGHSYVWSPGGETTAQISVSPAATTTYTVTATTVCGSASDAATVTVNSSNTLLDENFEGDTSAWSADGLWHLVDNSSCAGAGSPTHAFYYGQDSTCTYNSGAANSGSLTSPSISGITADTSLSFDFFRQVESYSGSYDRTEVQVVSGGSATTIWSRDSSDPSAASWGSSGALTLAAYAGQTIQIRFVFNSVDNAYNDFTGWSIDDVVVADNCQ